MPKRHVLGITAKRFKGRAFGEQSSYLRGLIGIAQKAGMTAYVFTPDNVDHENERVRAWVRTRKGWTRKWQPLPTVIHDRMWGIRGSDKDRFDAALARLSRERGIPVFNPDFGDKFEVHERLSQNVSLHPHLPETLLLSDESVDDLLTRHNLLYVKPVRGRQGKGISRVRLARGRLEISQRSGARGVRRFTTPPHRLVSACARTAPPESYIAQQGLRLLSVRGGTVDVRVIVQRDGRGEWHVTAVGCRIGQKGGFVSNLHAGGTAAGLPLIARHLGGRQSSASLRSRIEELALETARTMEASFPTIGEIGLDLGLDVDGHLWILELNRQPGRALFARAKLRSAWSRSRVRVVRFARYLSTL